MHFRMMDKPCYSIRDKVGERTGEVGSGDVVGDQTAHSEKVVVAGGRR